MKIAIHHEWDISFEEARTIQSLLCHKLKLNSSTSADQLKYIAAVDVSFNRFSSRLFGAAILYRVADHSVIETVVGERNVDFPYVPGYLSFREIPVLLPLLQELTREPDVILCDGQGIAHPRGLGLASHLGVILDKPTIGCAKSVLVGSYREPGEEKGSYSSLEYEGKVVGAALRTRSGVKPVYVSPGHRITLELAIDCVLRVSPKYRIPEPLRLAHRAVNDYRREKTP
ncbi:MAG: deoxyribonuclease V [Calditrichia bacterium]